MSELQKRNIFVDYHTGNPGKTKYQVWKYFSELGVAKQTIFDVLNKCERFGSVERTLGSRRLAKKMKRKQKALLITETVKKGQSQNQTANKFRISQSYVFSYSEKKSSTGIQKGKISLGLNCSERSSKNIMRKTTQLNGQSQ